MHHRDGTLYDMELSMNCSVAIGDRFTAGHNEIDDERQCAMCFCRAQGRRAWGLIGSQVRVSTPLTGTKRLALVCRLDCACHLEWSVVRAKGGMTLQQLP